jgi:hypothetical protein
MELEGSMDRRKFVRLLAAGAAVAATMPVAGAGAEEAASSAPKKAPAHRAPTAAMQKEIQSQRKSVADMLKVVREFQLPAGSPPATIFRAMKAAGRTK